MGTVTAPAPWKQLLLSALESNAHLRQQLVPMVDLQIGLWFSEDCDKIQINTDRRTCKIEELKHCPFAEVCWYLTDSWEQFRINGTRGGGIVRPEWVRTPHNLQILAPPLNGIVDIIDGSNADPMKLQQREKSWFAGSLRSRVQYLGPTPGLPNLSEQPSNEVSLDPSTGPVGAFCLLFLDPHQVDYLNLKSNQRRSFTSTPSPNGEKAGLQKGLILKILTSMR